MLRQVIKISSGSSLGKLLGLFREILFASFFGTTSTADAYRAAFTTTLSSNLLISETLASAFVPLFRQDRETNARRAWSLFNGLGVLLILLSIAIGAVLYVGAWTWVTWIFPGFSGERLELTVYMLQVMAIGMPFYTASSILINLMMAASDFHLTSIRAFVQNIGVIIALIIAFLWGRPVWIAWGFTGTYLIFFVYGIGWLLKSGILESGWYRHWVDLRSVAKRFWTAVRPLAFLSVLVQGNILLEKAIASLIGPGAVATIDYARLIPETMQVLVVVPIGLVSLAAMGNFKDEEVRERTDRISAMILLVLIPLSGFVLVAAPSLIRLLYARGAFDEASVIQTSQALRGMAVGMWAFCLAYVLQKIYNARMRNREVLRIAGIAVLANAIFNLVFYRHLGLLAIGLGFSLGGIVMTWFYVRGMGGLDRTRQIAWMTLLAAAPYALIGFLLSQYGSVPLLDLSVQIVWAVIFWFTVLGSFPLSRQLLRQFSKRLISVRTPDP